jgi:hypothetical protein
MNIQTSLFENIALQKAAELLRLLNEGRKEKELYKSQYYFNHNGYLVFIVATKDKNVMCNVLDIDGNIPAGFSICWRNIAHVKQEINL